MKTLAAKLIVGICALQMGCSGDADSVPATGTGGLHNAIGGNTSSALGGTFNGLGGTSGTGGVTSAQAGGALGTGGFTTAAIGGAGAIGGNPAVGGAGSSRTGGTSATSGMPGTGGTASATSATGGMSAIAGANSGGVGVTGGKSTTGTASSGGTSAASGGTNGTGGVATVGGSPASGGTSQVGTSGCSDITSATDCDEKPGCHSVYQNPRNCLCAARGCCATFSRCADGEKAVCATQQVECDMAQPYCEDPAYVVSYSRGCYEGCVKPTDCGDAAGVCGSNCTLNTTLTAPVCTAGGKLLLTCAQPYPGDLTEIMNRNGCTDAGLGTVGYCCPPAIQTQCL